MTRLQVKTAVCLCASMLALAARAEYGILVNDSLYYTASPQSEKDEAGRDQYKASVALEVGDHFCVYDKGNVTAFVAELQEGTQYGSLKTNFTESSKYAVCNVAGCYDFYIKLKQNDDRIWVCAGTTCHATPVVISGGSIPSPSKSCYGIRKEDGTYISGQKNTAYIGQGVEYMMLGISLQAGERFQLCDSCNSMSTWVENLDGASTMCVSKDDSWYTATETAQYDIYLKMIDFGNNVVFIGSDNCSQHSAVPSQSTDVLMQGFYYNSYEVNDTIGNGTDLYGDTRWRTLLKQSGEIGAYIDGIWLPPSALSSGTGYHPRQYSNQNSDWGTRTELQTLIQSFHNSGTKVIADIVANHAEAMASWCDFPQLNFGEYGVFQPDGSWICKDDEMNRDWTNYDSLANECWGTASGAYDDGFGEDHGFYKDARDWSHSEVKVQEMFKAYLLWMKNIIGYDGWRYDKGDGYHNWHMDNYNRASNPDIAFMEYWSGNNEIQNGIKAANMNVMALDFQTVYSAINPIAGWNFVGRGEGLMGNDYWKKYAVTWVDNHDKFMRPDNNDEFAGRGNSMTPALKGRLLCANALILSMPGIPCIFYPHWYQYKDYLKDMIRARKLAGVHNESTVEHEYFDEGGKGYQATIVGKNGYLILCLGTKTGSSFGGYTKIASNYSTYDGHNESYEMWVQWNNDVAPGMMATADATFDNNEKGIRVGVKAVGGSSDSPVIYYTTDGTEPTTQSSVYTDSLTFYETTTLKVMAVCGTAQSKVQTYTYTYREPLKRGIQVHFQKPEPWEKVYLYAWLPGTDAEGNATSENIMGAYPGQRIYQDKDGWYSYEFDLSMDSVNFCISSGDDCGKLNVRSNDLVADYDVYYGWEEQYEEESRYEKKLDGPIDLSPAFDLVISPESGNFRSLAEGQTVTLTVVGKEGAQIYYSTDGSDPANCAEPKTDSVSFTIHQTITVRAFAAYIDGGTGKEVKTKEYANTYTYKAPQDGPITVNFVKPYNWEDLYLYAFTRVKKGTKYVDTPYSLVDNKPNGKSSKWPGMKWTTVSNSIQSDSTWYTWTMSDNIHEIYVIFTEGNNKPQTQDIYLAENTCFVWNPDCGKAVVDEDCDGVANALPYLTEDEAYSLDFDQPMYNILGMPVDKHYRGIVIQNGHKFLLL
ncbi:MAG: chitobiase/beta-hexosaminidase C-terminal domain-containing protein [Paludibacteraceae bacterium]|nr:chitobiase/beta-hexosaminidase C-terminal domain-containing protein [Paludibacteraceae bacterium]